METVRRHLRATGEGVGGEARRLHSIDSFIRPTPAEAEDTRGVVGPGAAAGGTTRPAMTTVARTITGDAGVINGAGWIWDEL